MFVGDAEAGMEGQKNHYKSTKDLVEDLFITIWPISKYLEMDLSYEEKTTIEIFNSRGPYVIRQNHEFYEILYNPNFTFASVILEDGTYEGQINS